MADISKELSNIQNNKSVIENAPYGKDVRAAIAGISQAIYNIVSILNTNQTMVTNQQINGHQAICIFDTTNKKSITIHGNGEIFYDEDTDTSPVGRVLAQTRIFKHLDDSDVNYQTINLNTIEQLSYCIDVIVDVTDVATSFQLVNGPNDQNYESKGFHFTRLFNVEYFRSFYDRILWMRKDKGAWYQVSSELPSYG